MLKKFLEDAKVIENKQLGGCVWELVLYAPKTAKVILPGQFVHMQVDRGERSMLRRPFSVFDADGESAHIIYEVKGVGTQLMTTYEIGDTLSLIAPCGNSWLTSTLHLPNSEQAVEEVALTKINTKHSSLHSFLNFLKTTLGRLGSQDKNNSEEGQEEGKIDVAEIKETLIVGGGVGAAPLYMLTKQLIENEVQVDVVLGARTKDLLVLEDRYNKLGVRSLVCATDDGSYGKKGFCTAPAEKLIDEHAYDYVATCGPLPVMEKVASASKGKAKKVEVSCEERMACGVGACKTCVVDTVNGKVKSCECGPVFDAEVISW